jgi:hypothetical protein
MRDFLVIFYLVVYFILLSLQSYHILIIAITFLNYYEYLYAWAQSLEPHIYTHKVNI